MIPAITNGTGIRNSNSKSRVTIHDTIQIQQLLFKFVALFKISGTIQIQNMNSARALQLSGSGTQIHLLFGALCRALLVIMQIIWFLIMQYGCAMLFNDSDFLWMVDECANIMCVISEYAEYGMRASQDLGRLAKPNFQPVECLMLV